MRAISNRSPRASLPAPPPPRQYAIVSDPFEAFLFVLARNVTQFNAVYNASVYAELMNLGFDGPLNSPISTIHDGCTYSPP
jgi:hypothetical protein